MNHQNLPHIVELLEKKNFDHLTMFKQMSDV